MDDFDTITCEEFYNEDADLRAWMDQLEQDYVNFELQVLAEEQAALRMEVMSDCLALGA